MTSPPLPSATTSPSWLSEGSELLPWCDTCSQYAPPGSLGAGGECPDCDTVIGKPPRPPWHFVLLVVAVVVYLGWRAYQGVEWALGKL